MCSIAASICGTTLTAKINARELGSIIFFCGQELPLANNGWPGGDAATQHLLRLNALPPKARIALRPPGEPKGFPLRSRKC